MGTNKREREHEKNPHDDEAVGKSLYSMRLNVRDCVRYVVMENDFYRYVLALLLRAHHIIFPYRIDLCKCMLVSNVRVIENGSSMRRIFIIWLEIGSQCIYIDLVYMRMQIVQKEKTCEQSHQIEIE